VDVVTDGERRTFVDNRAGNTVASALAANAAYDGHQREIAIATGYFDLGGFLAIADVLERAPAVRILLGSEPEPPKARRVALPGSPPVQRPLRERLAELHDAIEADRDLLPFEPASTGGVGRLLAFLSRPTTQVRLYRRGFVHGKAFIFGSEAGVIAGSANFTAAGLQHNLELDLGVYDPDKVKPARAWFDDLWGEAEPFDLAAIYAGRQAEYDPYTIYLRMLYELYGAELGEEAAIEPAAPGAGLQLTEFQKLGVQRSLRILDRWGGVLLADGVGLGKTWIAGQLLEHHLVVRGWRVLVVAPASLRDATWDDFLARNSRYAIEVISYQQLANDRQVGDEPEPGEPDTRGSYLKLDAAEYRLIVVDEAHAFRSPETTYYRALRRLMAAGGVDKRLVLLTATPVNNSLWDLYWQLLLFARTESRFAQIGIPNLREHVAQAMSLDLEALTPAHLFPLLDQVSVRRTRMHIKRWFPNATIATPAGPVPIRFPEPTLHKVTYVAARPGGALPGEFFAEVAAAIDGGLSMARYQPDAYRRRDANATPDDLAAQRVTSQLLLSQLLKRFESSLDAFRVTLGKMMASHDRFLEVMDHGFVAQPRTSPEVWQEGLDDDALDALLVADENARPLVEYTAGDLRTAVEADRALLAGLYARAATIGPADDPKLDALLATLGRIYRAADHADERKVVLFSYYADTVDYVSRFLRTSDDPRAALYRDRMVDVTGAAGPEARQRIIWSFVPTSSGAPPDTPDTTDLLLSTDILAEGVNLQQCGRVINFDLPWNPMRLVQRNGRVDRIGSPHAVVRLFTFFPDAELDDMLDLEARLRRKIAQANAAVGTEGPVLPGDRGVERVFDDTREEIERIAAEDASIIDQKEGELDVFSGEVFREELRQALMAARERELRSLPWGIGSGIQSERAEGVVFAARAGARAEWRFVPLDAGSLSADRLALLGFARCTERTPRWLPESVEDRLFELWTRARADILNARRDELDPAKRLAAVPKAQRDAVQLLLAATSVDLAVQEQAIEGLSVPWPPTVARALRVILDREDESQASKAERLVELVRAEGLRAPKITAEPPITPDDVHLVCYQVVTA
jgi:hypothetical protein